MGFRPTGTSVLCRGRRVEVAALAWYTGVDVLLLLVGFP